MLGCPLYPEQRQADHEEEYDNKYRQADKNYCHHFLVLSLSGFLCVDAVSVPLKYCGFGKLSHLVAPVA
jgi:hypothetical protein